MTVETANKIVDAASIRPIVAEHVEAAYGRFANVGEDQIDEMTELLTNTYDTTDEDEQDEARWNAEKVRNVLWFSVGGGGASASVTNAIYAELGRSDETHAQW